MKTNWYLSVFVKIFVGFLLWRHDIRQDDTRHDDVQHNDTQHKGFTCDTQHKWHSAKNKLCSTALCINCHYAECLNLFVVVAECRYAECNYADCCGAFFVAEGKPYKTFFEYNLSCHFRILARLKLQAK